MHNTFIFFLPSRVIGGLETLFTSWAIRLSQMGYLVYYIDYTNGHFYSLCDQKLKLLQGSMRFIPFPENHPHQHTLIGANFVIESLEDVNLILPFTLSAEVVIKLTEKSKIMYYMCHPKSFDFLLYRSCVSYKQNFEHVKSIQYNICCQDEVNQQVLKQTIKSNYSFPIVPVFVEDHDETKYMENDLVSCNSIQLGWLGRLDEDKIYTVLNIIKNFINYKTPLQKVFHIIGDGNSKHKLFQNFEENVKIVFVGSLYNEEKLDYIKANIDVLFGMGISMLDAASIKVPSVLCICQDNTELIKEFIFSFDLQNYNNGFYKQDLCLVGQQTFTPFDTILNSIIESKRSLGLQSYYHFKKTHSLTHSIEQILHIFN